MLDATPERPLLIHCTKGTHRTGCIVGCLRKLEVSDACKVHAVCTPNMLLCSTPVLVAVTRLYQDEQLCHQCIDAALMARTNKLLPSNDHHLVDAALMDRTDKSLLSKEHHLVNAALMARTSNCEVMVDSLLDPSNRCSAGHTRRSLTKKEHVPITCLIDAAQAVLADLRRSRRRYHVCSDTRFCRPSTSTSPDPTPYSCSIDAALVAHTDLRRIPKIRRHQGASPRSAIH